jgi:hypothetical protein
MLRPVVVVMTRTETAETVDAMVMARADAMTRNENGTEESSNTFS